MAMISHSQICRSNSSLFLIHLLIQSFPLQALYRLFHTGHNIRHLKPTQGRCFRLAESQFFHTCQDHILFATATNVFVINSPSITGKSCLEFWGKKSEHKLDEKLGKYKEKRRRNTRTGTRASVGFHLQLCLTRKRYLSAYAATDLQIGAQKPTQDG